MWKCAIFSLLIAIPFGGVFASRVDKQSLCSIQSNGLPEPGPQIILIYDLSEPYPIEILRNVLIKLQSELSGVEPNTRLTLFIFDRLTAFHTSLPVDSFCLTGTYSSFDLLAPNKNILMRRRKAEVKRLEDFLQKNNPRQATQGSPIINALVSAATSQTVVTVATDIKIFLISDLIEYSATANFHSDFLTPTRARAIAEKVSANMPDLNKISNITFLYVKREKYIKMQNESLPLFWSELMSRRKIKSISFEAIQ